MFIILLVVALSLARPILLPVASAFVVTMMLGPLSARAERYRVPSLISAIVLWLLVIAVCYGVIVLLAPRSWIGSARRRTLAATSRKSCSARSAVGGVAGVARCASAVRQKRQSRRRYHELRSAGGSRCHAGDRPDSLFFGTLFFMLLGRSQLRRVLVAFFDERDARLRMLKIMNDIEHNLTGYLSIVTIINLALDSAVGLPLGSPACRIRLPGQCLLSSSISFPTSVR